MRIPLELDKNRTRLSVTVSVKLSGRSAIPVVFVVDTGSPVTFVDEYNTSKVRIFAKNFPFNHAALLGGTKIAMHDAGPALMGFRAEAGGLATIAFDALRIARTEWTRKEATYSSTSVLGLDFLLKSKAALHVNPYKKTAFMEIEG